MRWWLSVMLLFSGCAFGLSGPGADHPRSKMPKCDTGKGLVVLDGAMAATAGAVAISLAGENESSIALLPLGIGALYVAGAVSGNTKVNKCRQAMADYEEYLAAREALPAGAVPPAHDEDDDDDEDGVRVPRRTVLPPPEPASQTLTPAAPTTLATRQPAQAPVAPQPQAAPPPAPAQPVVATPAPATKAPARPAKPAPKQAADDDWSDFWREVEP